jgi:hypothetical protein
MAIAVELNDNLLPRNHLLFLSIWGVGKHAIYSTIPELAAGAYIWHGKFIEGETVAIVGREDMCRDSWRDPLFIGIAYEREMDPTTPLDVYINSAVTLVQGLHDAIDLLNCLRGLPNRQRLNLRPA